MYIHNIYNTSSHRSLSSPLNDECIPQCNLSCEQITRSQYKAYRSSMVGCRVKCQSKTSLSNTAICDQSANTQLCCLFKCDDSFRIYRLPNRRTIPPNSLTEHQRKAKTRPPPDIRFASANEHLLKLCLGADCIVQYGPATTTSHRHLPEHYPIFSHQQRSRAHVARGSSSLSFLCKKRHHHHRASPRSSSSAAHDQP